MESNAHIKPATCPDDFDLSIVGHALRIAFALQGEAQPADGGADVAADFRVGLAEKTAINFIDVIEVIWNSWTDYFHEIRS